MIKVGAISLGLLVIAANLPRRTDRLGLAAIALSLPIVAGVAWCADRARRWA